MGLNEVSGAGPSPAIAFAALKLAQNWSSAFAAVADEAFGIAVASGRANGLTAREIADGTLRSKSAVAREMLSPTDTSALPEVDLQMYGKAKDLVWSESPNPAPPVPPVSGVIRDAQMVPPGGELQVLNENLQNSIVERRLRRRPGRVIAAMREEIQRNAGTSTAIRHNLPGIHTEEPVSVSLSLHGTAARPVWQLMVIPTPSADDQQDLVVADAEVLAWVVSGFPTSKNFTTFSHLNTNGKYAHIPGA